MGVRYHLLYIYNFQGWCICLAKLGGDCQDPCQLLCYSEKHRETDLCSAQKNCEYIDILCVSCPIVTEYSAILFLLLARSSSFSPQSFQRFRQTLVQNFNWIRKQIKNFPIDLLCKNWLLFTMGVYGEFFKPVVRFE